MNENRHRTDSLVPAGTRAIAERRESLIRRTLNDVSDLYITKHESAAILRGNLHAAALYGHIDVLAQLVLADPDRVDETDERGIPLLSYAAFGLQTKAVRLLLEYGAVADKADPLGNTPLFYCLRDGGAAVSSVLLDAGANPNHVNEDGQSAIQRAVSIDPVPLPKLLLEFDEPPETNNTTSSHLSNGVKDWRGGDPAVVLALVDGGVHLSAKERRFIGQCRSLVLRPDWGRIKNSLIPAAVRIQPDIILPDDPSILCLFSNPQRDYENWPLFLASEEGYAAALSFLLVEGGCNPNCRAPILEENLGKTPLFQAESPAIATLLVKAGAEVDARSDAGYTPLTWGARFDSGVAAADMVRTLIKLGADINVRDYNHRSPLHELYEVQPSGLLYSGLIEEYVALGFELNPLSQEEPPLLLSTVRRWDPDTADLLLSLGANASASGSNGVPCSLWAQYLGYQPLVEVFRRHGARQHSQFEVEAIRRAFGPPPKHRHSTLAPNLARALGYLKQDGG